MKKIIIVFLFSLSLPLLANKADDKARLKSNIDMIKVISEFATGKCNEMEAQQCYMKLSTMLNVMNTNVELIESKTKAVLFMKYFTPRIINQILNDGPTVAATNFLEREDPLKLCLESALESIK